ncbi:MAG: glycosyltransferase family 4 protein [Acidimicrobiia bacterium]|jgi:glycosyltransferase involved in cell wall biosynthesis|nr:glycosyltransferase family 4 protein [Acidimicrobiia bacterium]
MRVAILNQFYAPDLSPTAHLAASLATHRAARGDEVTVVAGAGDYTGRGADGGGRRRWARGGNGGGGPRVLRVWNPGLGRVRVAARLLDYLAFSAGALARVLPLPRQDVLVVMTTPPFLVVAAVAHKLLRGKGRRCRVVLWSMDCYPDAAERYGTIRPGGLASRSLRALNRWTYRHLDDVVCLDGAMVELLRSQYAPAGDDSPRFTVIPNWEPLSLFPPTSGAPPVWAGYTTDPVLADRFVVLYQGNLGYGHPYATVLGAAARLEADGDAVGWLFMGGGARWDAFGAEARAAGLRHLVRHGYLPKAEITEVLAGAGASLIILDDNALGVMSPSKLHSSLATGRPILYVGPRGSNVDDAIERFDCGVSLREGDVDGLVTAVRRLRDDPGWAADVRARARTAFETAYCDAATLPAFDELIDHRP